LSTILKFWCCQTHFEAKRIAWLPQDTIAQYDDMADFMEALSAFDWSEPASAEERHIAFATAPLSFEKILEAADALEQSPEE